MIKKRLIAASVFLICVMSPLLTFANQIAPPQNETSDAINLTQGTSSIGMIFLRYIIAVIFVVSLLYFTLKFISKKNEPKYVEGSWLNVLDYNYMGNNKGIYLVEINKEGYVLAVSEHQMTLLTKIDNEEFTPIKNDILLQNQLQDYSFNPFKKKEKESFQKHLHQNLKIAEKYFTRKRD